MENTFLLSRKGLNIPCRLTIPEFGEIRRVVLGVHGMRGSSQDAIQMAIAEEMDLFYAATLRFDFPAHGESPLGSGAFTLENCKNTLLAVAEYAKERFPQVEDLCIFATGFGAYITLLMVEDLVELPGRLKLVVQTPSVMMHQTLLAMGGISQQTFRTMDKIVLEGLEISYRFYEELLENVALTSYPVPMLILHGEDDAFINRDHIRQFHRINEGSKLVIIPGAGHRFEEDGAWDMVLDLTRDWFEFGQVFLSDWL